jgi:ElaB/YqjD/DUF883 family membrane-anchored ribosome-binding protein
MNTNPGAALDSTRKMASDAMDRTSEKLRGLRSSMSDSATAAQRQLGEYAQGTMRYVGDHPMKTALIAAAVGAAVAGLVIALRRQNNDLY